MRKYIYFIVLTGILSCQGLHAQKVSQFNSWWMYFGNHKLTEKLGLHTEYQFRRSDFASEWQTSLMRVGLDYHLPNKSMATAGYGWIVNFPYGEQPIAVKYTEHRIWEQFVIQQQVHRFYFHHRYRLEQRFLENVSLDSNGQPVKDGYRFRQRARYRLLVTVPVSRKQLEDNTLFVAAYDEVFLGFGKGIQRNILDQNRLFFALGWRFDKDFNVQLGYLNHYVIKGDGLHQENNHTLQAGITYNLTGKPKG